MVFAKDMGWIKIVNNFLFGADTTTEVINYGFSKHKGERFG